MKKQNAVIQEAHSKGLQCKNRKKTVHPSTLRGFVKEQVQLGKNPPSDLFGVYVANRVTIKKEDN